MDERGESIPSTYMRGLPHKPLMQGRALGYLRNMRPPAPVDLAFARLHPVTASFCGRLSYAAQRQTPAAIYFHSLFGIYARAAGVEFTRGPADIPEFQ